MWYVPSVLDGPTFAVMRQSQTGCIHLLRGTAEMNRTFVPAVWLVGVLIIGVAALAEAAEGPVQVSGAPVGKMPEGRSSSSSRSRMLSTSKFA